MRLRFLIGLLIVLALLAPVEQGIAGCLAPGPCPTSCFSTVGMDVPCGIGGWALALVLGTLVGTGLARAPAGVRGIKQRLAA